MNSIDIFLHASKSDARLTTLFDEACEYAQIYRLAKQRHKGCEGTGELMTLREEFRDTIGKLACYCKEKGYPLDIVVDDPDTAALELTRLRTGKAGIR
jgi:hypothetical protein